MRLERCSICNQRRDFYVSWVFFLFRPALAIAAICLSTPATRVFAQIAGFGDGTTWTLNGRDQDPSGSGVIVNDNDPATISAGTLTITTAMGDEARSAFYNTQQNIASFIATFTYQDTDQSPLGTADGFAFVVQTQGTTALGGDSSGLGDNIYGSDQPPTGPQITAIYPSAAELFYDRSGDDGGTDFGVNGSGSFPDATPTDPVNLSSGDPIEVTLVYNDTLETLSETLLDTTTGQTYDLTRSADITGAWAETPLMSASLVVPVARTRSRRSAISHLPPAFPNRPRWG